MLRMEEYVLQEKPWGDSRKGVKKRNYVRKAEKAIVIHPYNPEWKSFFIKEEKLLRLHLDGEYKNVIHIGSTSIEGLDAKPIIDISIAVYELKDRDFYDEKLSSIGYVHCNGSKFEKWILFKKDDCGQEYHVHLMPYDSTRLFKQILFKIYLGENPKAADLYVRKKKAFLALDDHMWYSMNKKPFVEEVNIYALLSILNRPNFWQERVENILGYVPYAELFMIPPGLSADRRIRALFSSDKEDEYYKMLMDEADFIGIVRRLLKRDMPLDQIATVTGLTIEEVENLRTNY